MTQRPRMTLSGTVLDGPDARALADFYRRLLGWTVRTDEPDWVTLDPSGGGAAPSTPAKVWPAGDDVGLIDVSPVDEGRGD